MLQKRCTGTTSIPVQHLRRRSPRWLQHPPYSFLRQVLLHPVKVLNSASALCPRLEVQVDCLAKTPQVTQQDPVPRQRECPYRIRHSDLTAQGVIANEMFALVPGRNGSSLSVEVALPDPKADVKGQMKDRISFVLPATGRYCCCRTQELLRLSPGGESYAGDTGYEDASCW